MAESAVISVESIHQTNGDNGFGLEHILSDTETEERMIEKVALRQAIYKLPDREKQVIHLRYFHGLTQDRVAKIMSISQVQVSRIEKKAIERLREMVS
jgi:RNA polymerase sporulation-specific sigma factor